MPKIALKTIALTKPTTKIVEVDSIITPHRLMTISGDAVDLPDPDRLVHLQLRRFAGWAVCNLHLQSIVRRHDEILGAGIGEVVVFHSSAGELLVHAADLPFAVVADPDEVLYAEFGAESAPRALLDPRAWPSIAPCSADGDTRPHWSPRVDGGAFPPTS